MPLRFAAAAVLRDRRGGTLIEFAMVALPFLFLIFAILEIGLIFLGNSTLANATLQVSRQIRVGKLMASGRAVTTSAGLQTSLSDFKAAICKNMLLVPAATCLKQVQVDLRVQSSFQNGAAPSTGTGGTFDSRNLCFYSGNAGDIVVMRAYYLWTVQTPLLLTSLATIKSFVSSSGTVAGNFFVLQSAEIFRNEPSASPPNSGSGC